MAVSPCHLYFGLLSLQIEPPKMEICKGFSNRYSGESYFPLSFLLCPVPVDPSVHLEASSGQFRKKNWLKNMEKFMKIQYIYIYIYNSYMPLNIPMFFTFIPSLFNSFNFEVKPGVTPSSLPKDRSRLPDSVGLVRFFSPKDGCAVLSIRVPCFVWLFGGLFYLVMLWSVPLRRRKILKASI